MSGNSVRVPLASPDGERVVDLNGELYANAVLTAEW